MKTRTMSVTHFERHCFVAIARVKAKSQAIIITRHGKPTVKRVPVVDQADEMDCVG